MNAHQATSDVPQITLRRNGDIVAKGQVVGKYQRLIFGGYEVRIGGSKLGANYLDDIRACARAAIAKATGTDGPAGQDETPTQSPGCTHE